MSHAKSLVTILALVCTVSATAAFAGDGCLSTVDALNAEIDWNKQSPEDRSAQILACAQAQSENSGSKADADKVEKACSYGQKPKCELTPDAARALELDNSLPQYQRDAMVRQYQTVFATQLHLDRYKILTASYLPQSSEYIVCGTGMMYKGDRSISSHFIFDSRTGEVMNVPTDLFERECATSTRVDLTQ